MRLRLFVLLLAGLVLTAGSGDEAQERRPRRGPKECAHDIESAHNRHRAEAKRCAHQRRNQAQCHAANDARLQKDLAHIHSVCGDYFSTQGDPVRDGEGRGGSPAGDEFETGADAPPVRRPQRPGSPGGGRPRVSPEPSPDEPGLLPPGFPFPPADARSPRATPHPRQPADARPVIVALGDSITSGYGVKPEEAYPAVLQRQLDAARYRYRVVNAGVTGETTTGALRRLDAALVPDTRILIVALGLNDFNRNRPINEIGTNLLTIIARARQRRIDILLCGFEPLPVFNPAYEDRFQAMYPAVAARTGVPLIPDLLKRVYASRELVQRDLIHPSAAGARVIAEDVFRSLRPMLSTAGAATR